MVKSVKRIIFVVIPSLLLALLIFLTLQFYQKSQSHTGALQVTSSPKSKVYLNDKYLGQTPLCKCEAADMVQTGDYTIRLVPTDQSLSEFQQKVTISRAVQTVVDRKFGKDSLSEGSALSLTPIGDKKKTELLIVSFPEGAEIQLDNNTIGKTPLLYKEATESDHVLKLSKNGYKEKTIPIRTPKGYKLTAAIYLSTSTDNAAPTPAPTSVASVTPTATVVILGTPTGFLRVRESASLDAAEIAQVKPDESYPLLNEQNGWYEIKLQDGKSGWISSEYAQRQ